MYLVSQRSACDQYFQYYNRINLQNQTNKVKISPTQQKSTVPIKHYFVESTFKPITKRDRCFPSCLGCCSGWRAAAVLGSKKLWLLWSREVTIAHVCTTSEWASCMCTWSILCKPCTFKIYHLFNWDTILAHSKDLNSKLLFPFNNDF